MASVSLSTRRFRVRACQPDDHHGCVVSEQSFEAAAVAYLENRSVFAEDGEVSVVVHDLDSGYEHCFRIDLATGETAPCG